MDDGSNNSKYLDPQCSALSMLADVATELHDQETNYFVPCIKFCLTPMKPMHNGAAADEVESLRSYDFLKAKTFKKPIKFIGSTFEEGASSKSFKEEDIPLINRKRGPLKCTEDAAFIYDDDDAGNVDVVDVVDQEWVPGESSKKKGKSKNYNNNKRQRMKEALDEAPSELPQEFMDKINEMGGTEITLLITKPLFMSDLKPEESRLLMPFKQIKNPGFLREEELPKLREKNGIQVTLIQPSLELTNLTLVQWDMTKTNGAGYFNYVLRSSWMKVVDSNQLKEGDKVQLWSFRIQEELHMALVKF